jgi:hypothetical protein
MSHQFIASSAVNCIPTGSEDLALFSDFDWKKVFSSPFSVPSLSNRSDFQHWLSEMTESHSSVFESIILDYSTVISRQPSKENIELSILFHPIGPASAQYTGLWTSENIFWSYPLIQRIFYNKDDSIGSITYEQVLVSFLCCSL